ncbi:MAG: serine/threonine protein kinase [Mesorhizobium sp.]|uniref:protein kinase domain-containing protein n=3 Tax=Mesorhizobium TaxID=68287 RepID=UPI000F751C40|nr:MULTISPECIES: protein kinase [unclassified Mesorhizobium]AZO34463.1 serine/threonine protein kinase [Mesorhizobium sp. M2A.F.Ca.ET.046.03.2.1]RWA90180.1 MAG: serine/threonine protein kinase [Mesorhizobium sp.]RWB38493.1 MAG: serine/threonine protein kinase [Mesorhizobium sp.]
MSDDDKTRISPNVTYAGVGTQLSGIYELDERIASGGMGEVYRGHNIQTGDHVAIKIVLPEFARDQTILSLFRKEASILNHLSHDAVVRYHVFTIDPGIGRPYLAMEFVDGQSLFDMMRRGPMPSDDVRRLCHRLASGLSAVHQAGAVHRDLSPDNIILPGGRVERAKIIDFGIARSATVGGETLIGGKFAGKYNYVSPEQLGLYGGEVSEQSDIYSLGLVLAAALRGKPLDMSGSQYEVIEKRRTVPDLSDIDPDFRELIEAMLQPDPRDRPASMAEIARATRGEDLEPTLPPPVSFGARERSGLPRAGWTAPPDSKPQTPPSGEPRFVEHVRPAYLSEPRPAPAATPASAPAPAAPKKPSRMPVIAGGAAAIAVLAVAGLYFSGVLAPMPVAETPKPLTPKPAIETAKPVAEAQQAETPKAQPQAPAAAQPEAPKPDTAKPSAQPEAEARTPVEQPATQPESEAKSQTPQVETRPVQPSAQQSPAPAPGPTAAEGEKPTRPASEPAIKTPEPSQAAENKPAQEANPPAAKPSVKDLVDKLSKLPKPAPSLPPTSQRQASTEPTPSPAEPKVPTASQPATPTAPTQPAQQPQTPATKQPETDVAVNVPKPALPSAEDDMAKWNEQRSWVRDFSGGNCFYANVTSGPGGAPTIEGYGTAVQPFEQLLGDFQSRFHIEPDISVRLITLSQCGVPTFLRFLDRSSAAKPQLVLDKTSIPDGAPVSGALYTGGGLVSNIMLIDHKGVAFNLDDRMVAQTDKVTFNIPIGLAAADKAAGKAVPQIMLVITGPKDIQAAMFSRPTPASELLPRILEEIEAGGSQFSATASYFRLGG